MVGSGFERRWKMDYYYWNGKRQAKGKFKNFYNKNFNKLLFSGVIIGCQFPMV